MITRLNFKEMRKANRIRLKDISIATGLSTGTISSYEHSLGRYTDRNARNYNERLMNAKLEELIERRNEMLHGFTDISKADFHNKIKTYLKDNNITITEFAAMCEINLSTLYSKNEKDMVSRKMLDKIMNATGWTEEQIRNGDLNNVKEDDKMGWIPSSKTVERIPVRKYDDQETPDLNHKVNVRFIFKDGKYFEEYDILKHVVNEITKEDFLKEVK